MTKPIVKLNVILRLSGNSENDEKCLFFSLKFTLMMKNVYLLLTRYDNILLNI